MDRILSGLMHTWRQIATAIAFSNPRSHHFRHGHAASTSSPSRSTYNLQAPAHQVISQQQWHGHCVKENQVCGRR